MKFIMQISEILLVLCFFDFFLVIIFLVVHYSKYCCTLCFETEVFLKFRFKQIYCHAYRSELSTILFFISGHKLFNISTKQNRLKQLFIFFYFCKEQVFDIFNLLKLKNKEKKISICLSLFFVLLIYLIFGYVINQSASEKYIVCF